MRKNAKLPKILGKKVQRQRKKMGLSQEAVAHKADISRAYMGYTATKLNSIRLKWYLGWSR